jgi:hypothetical protein
MGVVFTIIGYVLFAAVTLGGAVLAHSDWQRYTALHEAGQLDKKIKRFAQAP